MSPVLTRLKGISLILAIVAGVAPTGALSQGW